MMQHQWRQRAWVKAISGGRSAGPRIIEVTHLMRVDGIERLTCVKVGFGPVAGYLEALARSMSRRLAKRPEDLRADDLITTSLTLSLVDFELRRISELTSGRAAARHPQNECAKQLFLSALRQRVAARMLARLAPEFVVAASRLIQDEAARRGAEVWL